MTYTTKPSRIFWIISVIALLWYIFGTTQFFRSLVADQAVLQPMIDSGAITQDYVDFLLATPMWMSAAFGVATISGIIGSALLLMRKKLARVFFILSIIGAAIMYLYIFVLSGKTSVLPTSDYIIAATVIIVTLFMIWFSGRKTAKGILA